MLIIDIKDNQMNGKERQICLAYWSELNCEEGHTNRVQRLSEQYEVDAHVINNITFKSDAYLDDVVCDICDMNCPIEVPEDIAIRRSETDWICEFCLDEIAEEEEE